MRCSRVALSLLLAVFGAAVIALGPAGGQTGVAADLGLEPSPHTDTVEGAGPCQNTADWREHDTADGVAPGTTAWREPGLVSKDGTASAGADEKQPESGCSYAEEGYRTESGEDVDDGYGYYDGGDSGYSCPEEDNADEEQFTQRPNADEDCSYDYGASDSDPGNDHELDYANQDDPSAEDGDTRDNNVYETDCRSESEEDVSQYEEADGSYHSSDSAYAQAAESQYSYEPDTQEAESQEDAESRDSYDPEAYDSQSEQTDESQYSYEPDPDNSEYGRTDESDYSYEPDTQDAESQEDAESRDSYDPEAYNSQSEQKEESQYSYEPDPDDSEYGRSDESDYSYAPDTQDAESQEDAGSRDSYDPEAYDSQSEQNDESQYSYEPDPDDSEYGRSDESDYSYEPDTYESEYAKAYEADSGCQGSRDADPERASADVEDKGEYTYEYEYSHPEGEGDAEGLGKQSEDEVDDVYEDRSDYDYGYGGSQEGEAGGVRETESDTATDAEHMGLCRPEGCGEYQGYGNSEETNREESTWRPAGSEEVNVWEVIVSWASRSLAGLGDACYTLSRRVAGLSGNSVAVGSRQEGSVN
jgi:hypothetical protein